MEWPEPIGEVVHKRTGKRLLLLEVTRTGKGFVVEPGKDVAEAFIVLPSEVTPEPVRAVRRGETA